MIRGMQIKITIKYNYTDRKSKIKKIDYIKCYWEIEKLLLSYTA